MTGTWWLFSYCLAAGWRVLSGNCQRAAATRTDVLRHAPRASLRFQVPQRQGGVPQAQRLRDGATSPRVKNTGRAGSEGVLKVCLH